MKNYVELLNKQVRVITLIIYENGRKIKTEYTGKFMKEEEERVLIKEKDNTSVTIMKKRIKRIEEI